MKPIWYFRNIFGSSMSWYIFAMFFLIDAKAPWGWYLAFSLAIIFEKEEEIRDKLALLKKEKS